MADPPLKADKAMPVKSRSGSIADDLRMPADEFDEIMRKALQVPPERPEPKARPTGRPKAPAAPKRPRKRSR